MRGNLIVDLHNLTYRVLRRLRLQRFLNWNARSSRSKTRFPLLGEVLGSAAMLYGGSWKVDAFRRLSAGLPLRQVLDVGANEGQTLLDLLDAGVSEAKVFAFEPNLPCAFYLQRLVRLNNWPHVQVLPFALADGARCLTLELESEISSGATLVQDLRPGRHIAHKQIVPCFSLDQLLESGIIAVDPGFLLKIDVEGSELDVVAGSLRTLERLRPLVLCEVLWAHTEERRELMRTRNAELARLLGTLRYEIHRLVLSRDQRRLEGLQRMTEFPDAIYGEENAHLCDYAFVPTEERVRLCRLLGG